MRSHDAHGLTHARVPRTSPSPPATDASSLAGADASPVVDAVAGAAGALLALLSTYPLMTLNTRQHVEKKKKTATRRDCDGDGDGDERVNGTNDARLSPRVFTMMDELRAVANENGGLAGLYRGIEPAVIGTVTSQAVYNYFYAVLRGATARLKTTSRNERPVRLSALESLAIASVAGSINVVLTIPIWTVCVRMQAERADEGSATSAPSGRVERRGTSGKDDAPSRRWFSSSRNRKAPETSGGPARSAPSPSSATTEHRGKKTFLETAAAVWDESGPAGFWRGVVPSLMMVSNPALQYAFYESAGDAFRRRRARKTRKTVAESNPARVAADPRSLTAPEVFVAASLAKMGATILTYPVLLVKTRLQAGRGRRREMKGDTGKERDEEASASYDGAFDALRRIAREEGAAAFYRGMGTKMTQTVFAAALMFVTKEEIAKAVRAAFAREKAVKAVKAVARSV